MLRGEKMLVGINRNLSSSLRDFAPLRQRLFSREEAGHHSEFFAVRW